MLDYINLTQNRNVNLDWFKLPSQPGLPSHECSSGSPDIPAQILPQVPACLELDLKTEIFARRMPRRGRVHFVPRYFRCTSVSRSQTEPDARPLSLSFQRHQGTALLNNDKIQSYQFFIQPWWLGDIQSISRA